MAGFPDLADSVVCTCFSIFGRDVSYRAASADPDADPSSITIISTSAAQPSESLPGKYMRASVRLADLDASPETGDEITIGDTVYSVVQVEMDPQGAAAELLLRETG